MLSFFRELITLASMHARSATGTTQRHEQFIELSHSSLDKAALISRVCVQHVISAIFRFWRTFHHGCR